MKHIMSRNLIVTITVFLLVVGFVPAARGTGSNPVVSMDTSIGTITMELFPRQSPITVKNFLSYVKNGFYSGTIFHRVIPGFMVQGGGFTVEMQEKAAEIPIKNEAANGLKNRRGAVAMARTAYPDSATCQFFINVVNNEGLDYPQPDGYGYAVFGKVIDGMDVVDKIAAVRTGVRKGFRDVPLKSVIIKSIKIVR